MSENISAEITNDEKLFGLFSHLSIFFGGIIVPLIFWIINKDKSKYATFHSLQALWFHIAFAAVIILFVFIILIFAFGMAALAPVSMKTSRDMPILFIVVYFAIYGFIFALVIAMFIYSIVMGIKAYQGNLNKYPIIGKIVYRKVYG